MPVVQPTACRHWVTILPTENPALPVQTGRMVVRALPVMIPALRIALVPGVPRLATRYVIEYRCVYWGGGGGGFFNFKKKKNKCNPFLLDLIKRTVNQKMVGLKFKKPTVQTPPPPPPRTQLTGLIIVLDKA